MVDLKNIKLENEEYLRYYKNIFDICKNIYYFKFY